MRTSKKKRTIAISGNLVFLFSVQLCQDENKHEGVEISILGSDPRNQDMEIHIHFSTRKGAVVFKLFLSLDKIVAY